MQLATSTQTSTRGSLQTTQPQHNATLLVAKLLTTPLPPASHDGWSVSEPPFLVEDGDVDAGQKAEVQAQFSNGAVTAGFSFRVFDTGEQARASFDSRYTFARQQVVIEAPAGVTAKCLGGSAQTVCHALVGRTVVVVTMDGASVAAVAKSLGELAMHVERLER